MTRDLCLTIHLNETTGDEQFAFCQCDDDVGDGSGLFCNEWSCKQISSGGRAEFEDYVCQRPSASGHYCEAWNGNVSASNEYEVVTCECMANWHGDQVCSFWECEGAWDQRDGYVAAKLTFLAFAASSIQKVLRVLLSRRSHVTG